MKDFSPQVPTTVTLPETGMIQQESMMCDAVSTIPCVLQCGRPCDEVIDSITSTEKWENLKTKALLWRGLDKFGDVYGTVDWDKGPVRQYVYDTCRLTLSSGKKLEKTINRQRKWEVDESQGQSSSKSNDCFPAAAPV
ncbi:hypothetical protein SK128_016857 [Halocaridina rubra]|uniref:Uncharacterized protein n=1 Tax=Halocaridina rubra TaxID=373956 RepID=A0AAN8WRK2_HALRR